MWVRLLGGFGIGLIGWMVAATLRVENEGLWLVAVAAGLIAGGLVADLRAAPTVWLGMAVSIPVSLALGTIAFLGEGWAVVLVLGFVLAGVGFPVGLLGNRAMGRRLGIRAS